MKKRLKVKWAECKFKRKVILWVRMTDTPEGRESAARTAASRRENKLSDDSTLDWKSIRVRVFSDEEHEFWEKNWNDRKNWKNYLSEGGKDPQYIGPRFRG